MTWPDALAPLAREVGGCRRCPRMAGRRPVLSQACGPAEASVLFVAEAPGRLGADSTGVPLTADQTGRNFEAFLAQAGIDRGRVFVTNAVLCNPRDSRGRNATPSRREIRECSRHLEALIEALDPRWVVALGRVALESLGIIAPHGATLARDVGRLVPWRGRTLVPMYHPGPRSVARRGRARQLADYVALAAHLRAAGDAVCLDVAGGAATWRPSENA